jgi:hypothetical protein
VVLAVGVVGALALSFGANFIDGSLAFSWFGF